MDDRWAAGGPRRADACSYRLVEIDPEGREHSEAFSAPDDDAALERALGVGYGRIVELWRGANLIRRWTGAGSTASEAKLQ